VLALACNGSLLGEERVLVAGFAGLAELEGLVLLLTLQVVDDELPTPVVTVREYGCIVCIAELLDVESEQHGPPLTQAGLHKVGHTHFTRQVNPSVFPFIHVEFAHFDFRRGLLEERTGAAEPESEILVDAALHEGKSGELLAVLQHGFERAQSLDVSAPLGQSQRADLDEGFLHVAEQVARIGLDY